MTLSLATLLDRGRQYLAASDAANDKRLDTDFRIEVGLRALRRHSTLMQDVSLDDGQALLAACVGIIKWHERHAADGGDLGECLVHLENAMSSLEAHQAAEEEEPELPLYTRSPRSLEYA
jgi:hypothetical protein